MSNLTESGTAKISPTLRNRVYLVIGNLQYNGVKAGVSHYSQRFINIVTRTHGKPGKHEPNMCEEQFAAQTSDNEAETLAIQSENAKFGLFYEPSRTEVLHTVLRKIPVALEQYTFIDLGAGKGLPMLVASEYPFKRILGVEYSKTLADAAALNIQVHKAQHPMSPPIECICGDATEFVFPNEPTVLYLFNPFQAKVMDRVIANLQRSLQQQPRDLWVVYVNPWEVRKFRRTSMLEAIESNPDFSIHRYIRR